MFFSIITATFNSEKTLKKTLDSILNIDFKNFEYIIIDGNSSDSTISIIEEYLPKFKEKKIKFTFTSEADEGIYDAWNKGINISTGKWICFLGSDDCFLPKALSIYEENILNNPFCNYFHSKVNLINNKNEVLKVLGHQMNKSFLRYMNISHVGSFHKKELFDNQKFNLKYKIVGDYEFLLRNFDLINAFYINKITANMLVGGASFNVKKALKETLDLKIELKTRKILFSYFDYYYSYFKARLKQFLGLNN